MSVPVNGLIVIPCGTLKLADVPVPSTNDRSPEPAIEVYSPAGETTTILLSSRAATATDPVLGITTQL